MRLLPLLGAVLLGFLATTYWSSERIARSTWLGQLPINTAARLVESTADGGVLVALAEGPGVSLIKLDADGVEQWQVTHGLPGDLFLVGLVRTHDDGFVIAASSFTNTNATVLLKVDAAGSLLWAEHIDAPEPGGIAESAGGEILLVGSRQPLKVAATADWPSRSMPLAQCDGQAWWMQQRPSTSRWWTSSPSPMAA